MQAPRRLRSLARQRVQGAQDVSRVEIDAPAPLRCRIIHARRADRIAVVVHVVQQPAHVLGGEIAFQSPRCVRVADSEGEVGHVAEHHSFVDERLRQIDRRAVDDELHPAE